MTKEEFKSRIEDIIDDNRIYGWDTVTVLIMEEIDKTLPPFNVDWEKTWIDATINIASSMAMNNPELKELSLETIAKISCNLADNLINELKKGSHGKGRM